MSILVFYGVSGTVGTGRLQLASFWPTERVALEPVCWWEKSLWLEVLLSKSVHESVVSIVLTPSVQVLIFHLLPLCFFFQNLKTKCWCCCAICNVSSDLFSRRSRDISENAGLGSYFLQHKLRTYKRGCHPDIMLAVNASANYSTSMFVHVIGYEPYWYLCKTCHIVLTIHAY